jgi:hypothetical protein
MDFTHINFDAIAVGTLAAFALGFLWYSPMVFGRTWMRYAGIREMEMKDGKGLQRLGPALALLFLIGVMLDVLLPAEVMEWDDGAAMSVLVGLAIVAPSIALHYIFARRSVQLFLIDAGYSVFSLLILGAILVAMS